MTIKEAQRRLGVESDYALAKKLGVTRFAISKWRKRHAHRLPEAWGLKVESMEKGK